MIFKVQCSQFILLNAQHNRTQAHVMCEVDSKLPWEVLHSYVSMHCITVA
jgi:hypothetical protein